MVLLAVQGCLLKVRDCTCSASHLVTWERGRVQVSSQGGVSMGTVGPTGVGHHGEQLVGDSLTAAPALLLEEIPNPWAEGSSPAR